MCFNFSYSYYRDFSLWLAEIIHQTTQGTYLKIYYCDYKTSKIPKEHYSAISITAAILFKAYFSNLSKSRGQS